MENRVGVWICGNGHRFTFGDESWHREVTQGYDHELGWVPMYCTADFSDRDADPEMGRYEGEPCMDSSSLICEE